MTSAVKISGFTFLRNGAKLHYPIIESIRSARPLVNEFVIALGDSDPDDDTRERIEQLGAPKVMLFDTVWDLERFCWRQHEKGPLRRPEKGPPWNATPGGDQGAEPPVLSARVAVATRADLTCWGAAPRVAPRGGRENRPR